MTNTDTDTSQPVNDNSIDIRRSCLQTRIDAGRTPTQRNRLGQFATPDALADDIAKHMAGLVGGFPVRFADPSIGLGSFFAAARKAFGADLASAIGVEIDPLFAAGARELWAASGLEIVEGDFTRLVGMPKCPSAPNLILANPPYVRHHHIEAADKLRLRDLTHRLTGIHVNGLAGLYVYFLLLATAWMQEGAWAAWLVPSEFMDVNYGMAIKHYLTENVTLMHVHRFDPNDAQFGDALVSSAVVIFQKQLPPPGHSARFTFGGTLRSPRASDSIPVEQLRGAHKWTAFPAHAGNDRVANDLRWDRP